MSDSASPGLAKVKRVSALSHLRIIELSDGVAGEYCGKLLADFGAEILKVEMPGTGSDTRGRGPFAKGAATREGSGLFAYLNTNKRSVCIDLSTSQGQVALHKLIESADAIVDDHPSGYLERLRIDSATLGAKYPRLIVCAITPFGYDAPATMQKAYSLNVFHSSGWGYHSPSEPDLGKPPLKGAGRFHVDYESGLSAALALVAAVHWRGSSGRGQFLDVSQQQSLATLSDYVLGQMVAGTMEVSTRRQAFDLGGPATIFQCLDGYVYLWLSEPGHWNGLRTLMGEPASAWMLDFPERWLELHLNDERIQRCRAHIAHWMKAQHKLEVATRAQKLGVPVVPVNTAKDLFESEQLQFRGFFAQVEHPILGSVRYPTVPYKLSATPARIDRPAPLLGEHTESILAEAAATKASAAESVRAAAASRAAAARQAPAAAASLSPGLPTQQQAGPLQGVRVLELTKIWAGPYTGKLLALLGAEVIRVESYDSLDATRRYGVKDINDAPGFQAINPGKCSVQFNVRTDEGRRLVKELVKVSDIFIENLRPGAAGRLGLGYDVLRSLKPEIVAVSMSMYGHEGPLSYQTGYAPCFSALAGVCNLVGYEGGPPQLLNIRYGDSSYGTAAAFAAIVALCHRQRTGQGQFVDVSAVESLAAMLGDSFMEYSLTGRVPERDGSRHTEMAPHGCYPCMGDEWISIAVRTDDEWRVLCEAMGVPALAGRYPDSRVRQTHAQELDETLASWTRTKDAQELGTALRSRGVAAFKSLNSIDLVSDGHLWERGFYTHVTDSKHRSIPIVGAPWRMSATPPSIHRAAPLLGEHNDYVLGELLGLSTGERQRLIAEKIVY
jgi:crotonobetainyl-CoA:carnitine CoA-transferase CaiB-like acyl-CoA transferase